jgi:LPS export ABC transporter protein LptC
MLPLLVVLVSPLWWPAVAGFLRPHGGYASTPSPAPRSKQFALEGVFFTQSREGQEEWQITAAQLATAPQEESELHLERVEAQLFGKSERRLQVSSDQALYDGNSLTLTLIDDVRVQLRNGYELRTEVLQYLDRDGKIETGAPVRLVGRDLLVRGQGMVYDLKAGYYSVGGRVTVLLK